MTIRTNPPYKWYCQPDGGQYNVRVSVVETLTVQDTSLSIIVGENLSSMMMFDNVGVLLVRSDTLFDIAQ